MRATVLNKSGLRMKKSLLSHTDEAPESDDAHRGFTNSHSQPTGICTRD